MAETARVYKDAALSTCHYISTITRAEPRCQMFLLGARLLRRPLDINILRTCLACGVYVPSSYLPVAVGGLRPALARTFSASSSVSTLI